VLTNDRSSRVFVTGQCCDGIQRLLLIVEPTFESHGCEFNLLLDGIIQLSAAQSPHVQEVKRAYDNKRHSYAGGEEQ
jgi:hypothetical protein